VHLLVITGKLAQTWNMALVGRVYVCRVQERCFRSLCRGYMWNKIISKLF